MPVRPRPPSIAPRVAAPRTPAPPRDAPPAPATLRLSISRAGLGLELARPVRFGCVDVVDLAASLPATRFPIDVSGGVARFRHRRGQMERLSLDLPARALEQYAAPRLRGLLGPAVPEVTVSVRQGGATLSIATVDDVLAESPRVHVLAFDVLAMAEGSALLFVVTGARGIDLPSPATAMALHATRAILGESAAQNGASFFVARVAERLARAVYPDAGARAPSAEGMVWASFAAHEETWILHAMRDGVPLAPSDEAVKARELARLTREGDEARLAGDLEAARGFDVAALERAPRHPEIARRLAEIDLAVGGRAEAALATLAEAERDEAWLDGALVGSLRREVGDAYGAIAAFTRAAEADPCAALSARALECAAALMNDPYDALSALDQAVARAPRAARLRWARLAQRVAVGRLGDAIADAEHLEALVTGPRARFTVWERAGAAWSRAGHRAEAGALFERALRYRPDTPKAVAGLGEALVASGRAARGVELLTRAHDLCDAANAPDFAIDLALARALAEALDDRPAAIARVRLIPLDAHEGPVARGIEGRWRASIGDLAGASLSFARLRDVAATWAEAEGPKARREPRDRDAVADLLVEAARFEREKRNDPHAAQRHLAIALRLRPHDEDARVAYREVGMAIAGMAPHAATAVVPAVAIDEDDQDDEAVQEATLAQTRELDVRDATFQAREDEDLENEEHEDPEDEPSEDDAESDATNAFAGSRISFDETPTSDGEAIAAARVEELTRKLHADPTQDSVAEELSTLLQALGRSHELLALLSARLEDASPDKRVELLPATLTVLDRLYRDAVAEGRTLEAQLFKDARDFMGNRGET